MRPDITTVDPLVLVALIGSAVFFGILAVIALVWAQGNGQFDNLGRGSRSIFDPDEPEGRVTDAFPGPPERD